MSNEVKQCIKCGLRQTVDTRNCGSNNCKCGGSLVSLGAYKIIKSK